MLATSEQLERLNAIPQPRGSVDIGKDPMYTNYSPLKKARSDFRSICSLGIVSLFLFFLAASAPHRVHHIFENLLHSDENFSSWDVSTESHDSQTHRADHKKDDSTSAKTDCVAASVAQNAHVSIVQVPEIGLRAAELQGQSKPQVLAFASFNPSPFGERAPPSI